jgi:hypothetical protein
MRKTVVFVRVISLCLFLCSESAWSAAVPLTSDTDSGPNTLRAALANADPGDTIVFARGVDDHSRQYVDGTKNVAIDGAGSAGLTISGNHAVPLVVDGNPAWGGHQAALGWQTVQAELSACCGNIILLRFAFRSDTSGIAPGSHVDSFSVQWAKSRRSKYYLVLLPHAAKNAHSDPVSTS